MTKDKIFNSKNLRILLIVSICVLALFVAILPVVTFKYTKNKFKVTPPNTEEIIDDANNQTGTPEEQEVIVWTLADTDSFYYSSVEGSADVYISGIKDGVLFDSEYLILPHEFVGGGKIVGVDDEAFKNKLNIKGLVIPNVYSYIGKEAFASNINLKVLVLGNTEEETEESLQRELMIVEDDAFADCTELSSITMGVSVGEVKNAFTRCSKVSEIIIYSSQVYSSSFNTTYMGGILEVCPRVLVYSKAYNGQNAYFTKFYTMGQTVIGGKSYIEYSLNEVVYEISLNACGGNLNGGNILRYKPNSTRVLPLPSLSYYNFCGWYDNIEYEGEPIENISPETKGNFSLYAKWELIQYEINYVISGGTNHSENPQTFTAENQDIEFGPATKDGYIFGGWFSDSANYYPVETLSDLLDEDLSHVTLYAKFTPMFSLSGGFINGFTQAIATSKKIEIPRMIDGNVIIAIGNDAFANHTQVEEIIINGDILSIGSNAFKNCINLKRIAINSPLRIDIQDEAFSGCIALENINIEDWNIGNIGQGVFSGCESLETMDLSNNSFVSITVNLFKGCKSLTSVYLPTSVRYINAYAFAGCEELSYINLGDLMQLSSIRPYSFEDCKALSVLSLELNSLSEISEFAFSGCSGLKIVDLSKINSLRKIGESAFEGCTSLQTLTLNSGLETISTNAFKNCTSLKTVTIPAMVTTVGVGSFSGSGVESVSFVDGDNWYAFESEDDTVDGKDALDLSGTATNADKLKGDYANLILKKITD